MLLFAIAKSPYRHNRNHFMGQWRLRAKRMFDNQQRAIYREGYGLTREDVGQMYRALIGDGTHGQLCQSIVGP